MSKQEIRKRKKRIQRIRRRAAVGTAFAGVAAVTIASWAAFAQGTEPDTEPIAAIQGEPIGDIKTEPIESIQTERSGQTLHIKEESKETPRTYQEAGFVPLPVSMKETDQAVIFGICQEYCIAFPLVMAIIEHESQFDGAARSKTGDSGYMQINDCNTERLSKLGFSDLYDLEQNVGAGVYILKELFIKHEGDVTFVLMAYNAGEARAREMREAGIYETEYTIEILERAEVFSSYIDNETEKGTNVR